MDAATAGVFILGVQRQKARRKTMSTVLTEEILPTVRGSCLSGFGGVD